jgi:hypothetical protein
MTILLERRIPRFQDRSAELQIPRLCIVRLARCRFSFFGFAAGETELRKELRPVLFNPCSAPATPAQTWGTRPGGQRRCRTLGFNLEKDAAGCLTIQTVARDDKRKGQDTLLSS